jgi:hypothetical protein
MPVAERNRRLKERSATPLSRTIAATGAGSRKCSAIQLWHRAMTASSTWRVRARRANGAVARADPLDLRCEPIAEIVAGGYGQLGDAHDVDRRDSVEPRLGRDGDPIRGFERAGPGRHDDRPHQLRARLAGHYGAPVAPRGGEQVVHPIDHRGGGLRKGENGHDSRVPVRHGRFASFRAGLTLVSGWSER